MGSAGVVVTVDDVDVDGASFLACPGGVFVPADAAGAADASDALDADEEPLLPFDVASFLAWPGGTFVPFDAPWALADAAFALPFDVAFFLAWPGGTFVPFDAPCAFADAELPFAFFLACPGGTLAAGESDCVEAVADAQAPEVTAAGWRTLSDPAGGAAAVAPLASLEPATPVAGAGDSAGTFAGPPDAGRP